MKTTPSLINRSSPGTGGTFRPQLTSLIDVMTILLVFLIKSFSVEGNLVTPSRDLELPVSTSQTPPKAVLSLEIARDAVLFEGEPVARHRDFAQNDTLVIDNLYAWLREKSGAETDSTGAREVLLQCDREVPFNILKRVMVTCSRAGFSEYAILVIEEEEA